jgi:hypothetical protein
MNAFLQLILAITFVVLACFLTYKITLPICLKIIDLCFESKVFRIGICIFLAGLFCAVGIVQLKDFANETGHGLHSFFPLSFSSSGIFLFLIFWSLK